MFDWPVRAEKTTSKKDRYRISPSTWHDVASDGVHQERTAWAVQERYNGEYYTNCGKFNTLEEAKSALTFMEEQERNSYE